MVAVAQIIGGAGCGKTTELLRLMELNIANGLSPMEIGFVSFTRAARHEAATRAAKKFGIEQKMLEQNGWFRTLHSICYRQLKVSAEEVLTDCKKDRDWLKEALQVDIEDGVSDSDDNGILSGCFERRNTVDLVLGLWSCARNRLVPFADVWERAKHCDDRTPDLDWCVSIINRYEQHKAFSSKLDFTDLLGRFSGWRFGVEGHELSTPRGDVPHVPVWFLDEAQDNSALSDAVARRLVAPATYAYIVGDLFQAIYGWSGSDPKHFMSWGYADKNRHILPRTYRYGASVLELGESILRECSDYFDRGIAPAPHDTEIETAMFADDWVSAIEPGSSWLLLARTNFHAARIARRLEEQDIPWTPLRGMGGVNAPAKNAGMRALYYLQHDIDTNVADWKQAVKLLPAKFAKAELLTRGTKTRWAKAPDDNDEDTVVGAYHLEACGATEALRNAIANGSWVDFIDGATRWRSMCQRWETVDLSEIDIRVGTIHAAKGAEADNVLVLPTSSEQIHRGTESDEGRNEEARVAYVAATRCKKRLVVAKERCMRRIDLNV